MAGAVGSIEPAGAVRLLVRLGELPGDALLDGSLSVEEASRRNRCLIVRHAEAGWVFKQATDPATGEVGEGGPGTEQRVYEHMGEALPAPRFVYADAGQVLLVTAFVTGQPAVPDLDDEVAARRSGRAWGRLVRAVHRSDPDAALDELAPPWPLYALRPRTVDLRVTSAATDELLQALHREESAPDALDALRADYRADTFVHGDLRGTNVLRDGDRLTAIDWEGAGRGDRRWDLAAPLAEALAAWVRDAAARQGQALVASTFPLGAFARSLVDAYRAPADRAAFEALAPWVGARLLQLAIEAAQTRPTLTGDARRLAQLAINVLDRPGDAVRWLFMDGDP